MWVVSRKRRAQDAGLEDILVRFCLAPRAQAGDNEFVNGEALGQRHPHGATPFARHQHRRLGFSQEIVEVRQAGGVRLEFGDGDDGEILAGRRHQEVDVKP